nr:helix-turn-helix domain-containing protein [Streptomyces sp. SID5770]
MQKAIRILHVVSKHGPIGIGEVSRRAEMPKTTVHRIINCLHSEGILEKTTRGYNIVSLQSQEMVTSRLLRDAAAPHLLDFYISTTLPIGLAMQKSGAAQFLSILYTSRQCEVVQEFTEPNSPVSEATQLILESHKYFTQGGSGRISSETALKIVQQGIARVQGTRNTGIAMPIVATHRRAIGSVSIIFPLAQHASGDRVEHLLRATSHNIRRALTDSRSPRSNPHGLGPAPGHDARHRRLLLTAPPTSESNRESSPGNERQSLMDSTPKVTSWTAPTSIDRLDAELIL